MATYVTAVNNLTNLLNLGNLYLTANQITTLDLSNLSGLQDIRFGNNNLSTLDLSDSPNLGTININSNPNLSNLILPILPFCGYFNAFGCSLPTSTINAILVSLASNNSTGGNVFLDGGSNGIPTITGINAANTLTSRSWNVTYNT
jgi:hypothetical protein